MIHVILYLLIAYCVVFTVAVNLVRRRRVQKLAVRVAILAVLLCAPLIPYGVVSVQTAVYGRDMIEVARQAMPEMNGRPSDIRDMKVLCVWPSSATLYVITGIHGSTHPDSGLLVKLTKNNSRWRFSGDWRVVWADGGSADGNVFPPYCYGK